MVILVTIISFALAGLYLIDLTKAKFDVKTIVMIAMFSAMAFVLYLIQFIKYPQGGGVSLCSMLPIMLLSILYGRRAGLTGGLIFGLLKLLNGATVVHPAQFLLDYVLASMALGLAGTFGVSKKLNLIGGCLLAAALSLVVNIVSGAIFFGEYANGMNVWLYSIIYNGTTTGVEGLITVAVMAILPIERFSKISHTA